jgi:hypothetical protein
MAIRELSLQEFDRFRSARSMLARLTDKTVEWFADDTGRVLGVISYHRFHSAWSFVVLGRDKGSFCAITSDTGLRDLDEARRRLLENMALALPPPDSDVSSSRTAASNKKAFHICGPNTALNAPDS